MSNEPIRIRAETSITDPHSCAFIVDRTVYDGKRKFDSAKEAECAPYGSMVTAS